MSLDLADYLASVDYREHEWSVFDQTLYRLCNEHPGHSEPGAVNAKLWLIGRGMSTGIERHIKSSGGQGSSLDKMARRLRAHAQDLDALVQQVRPLAEPLDLAKLSTIVAVHGKFCDLVSQITHGEKTLVSFSAKYLHFHAPLVPIYDGLASEQAWRMRKKEGLEAFPQPAGSNPDYYWYCLCFWQVYSGLRGLTDRVNVRLAECYLLWLLGNKD